MQSVPPIVPFVPFVPPIGSYPGSQKLQVQFQNKFFFPAGQSSHSSKFSLDCLPRLHGSHRPAEPALPWLQVAQDEPALLGSLPFGHCRQVFPGRLALSAAQDLHPVGQPSSAVHFSVPASQMMQSLLPSHTSHASSAPPPPHAPVQSRAQSFVLLASHLAHKKGCIRDMHKVA